MPHTKPCNVHNFHSHGTSVLEARGSPCERLCQLCGTVGLAHNEATRASRSVEGDVFSTSRLVLGGALLRLSRAPGRDAAQRKMPGRQNQAKPGRQRSTTYHGGDRLPNVCVDNQTERLKRIHIHFKTFDLSTLLRATVGNASM